MKKPTIIEINVTVMDNEGIEKDFHFTSLEEFRNWWKDPYKKEDKK